MKYALITGGSRGIGRAVCEVLAKNTDYGILINYNSNKKAAEETKEIVEKHGNKAEILAFDVSDKSQVEEVLNAWQEKNKEAWIEVLVNNAGITKDGLFMWMKEEDWSSVINTSLSGFYNVSQFVIQKMLRKRFGRIVNMVSVSGVKGTPGQTNYSAAKGAVIGATKALAQEVGKRNITVNAVAPGFIKSDMTAELNEKELKRNIPANRFGEAWEVAELVNFLVSKNASYINGEVININGGLYS